MASPRPAGSSAGCRTTTPSATPTRSASRCQRRTSRSPLRDLTGQASSWCAARSSCRVTGTARRRRRGPCPAAGSTPATSPGSPATARSSCSIGATTWSTGAARTSTAPRSRTPWPLTRPSPRSRSSACPTTRSAVRSPPPWSRSPALRSLRPSWLPSPEPRSPTSRSPSTSASAATRCPATPAARSSSPASATKPPGAVPCGYGSFAYYRGLVRWRRSSCLRTLPMALRGSVSRIWSCSGIL
ncbi:MAG: hypothetical protein QOH87_1556 [Trebonia sp.]|nr:hypothetical protein [Trebonia sp.]